MHTGYRATFEAANSRRRFLYVEALTFHDSRFPITQRIVLGLRLLTDNGMCYKSNYEMNVGF
jgi:hypothetical protein